MVAQSCSQANLMEANLTCMAYSLASACPLPYHPPNLLSGGLLAQAISLELPPFLLVPDQEHWGVDYPDCMGTMQSPINIDTAKTIFSPELQPIQLSGYSLPANEKLKLRNNGHTGGCKGTGRGWSTSGAHSASPGRTGLL